MNTTCTKIEFLTHSEYHPAVGFEKSGHTETVFLSRCGRFYARIGVTGYMILKDRKANEIYPVKGKMPEVIAKATELAAA